MSDVKWIGATQRLIASCDSGICVVDDVEVCQYGSLTAVRQQ